MLLDRNSVEGVGHLFRWSEESGTVDLGSLHDDADGPILQVFDSTPDGRIVVGSDRARNLHDVPPEIAFRWSIDSGLEQIAHGQALAVSDDGNVVVGEAWGAGAFRWTSDAGPRVCCANGRATDVSADGAVVVGWGWEREQAFRWSMDDGLQLLDMPPGRDDSYAHAVSADGNVVLGTMQRNSNVNYPGNEVFRWTAESGVEILSPAEDAVFDGVSTPLMSRLGDVIVANGWSDSDETSDRAFIWREGHGTQFLRDVLANEFQLADQLDERGAPGRERSDPPTANAMLGLALPRGVDNRVVVWVATIPEPSGLTLLAVGGLALISRVRPDRRRVPHSTT